MDDFVFYPRRTNLVFAALAIGSAFFGLIFGVLLSYSILCFKLGICELYIKIW